MIETSCGRGIVCRRHQARLDRIGIAHEGRIWTEPNPGGGTIFRFSLPAVEEQRLASVG